MAAARLLGCQDRGCYEVKMVVLVVGDLPLTKAIRLRQMPWHLFLVDLEIQETIHL